MNPPENLELPFFSYGIFRPGQIAFFQIIQFVNKIVMGARIKRKLLLRDGLPIIDPEEDGFTEGAVLKFLPDSVTEAYSRISSMEPKQHYRWFEAQTDDGTLVNALVGRSPKKGSVSCEEVKWNGWSDPLFAAALDVVEETLKETPKKPPLKRDSDWDFKPFFRLQMAYLLLWSSIERYVSLRYHLGDDVVNKINNLSQEPAFASGLLQHVKRRHEVYRSDKPSKKEILDPDLPNKAVGYYYQVRSNITHRGKGVYEDFDLLRESLKELLPIFRDILKAAEHNAGKPGVRS